MSEYEENIKKLIRFVDENFKPIGLRDLLKASGMFRAIVITLIILLVYLIGLSPFTPIANQIPWAIAFVALVLVSASVIRTYGSQLRTSVVNQQFRRIYPLLDDKREQTKYLLFALLAMKVRKPSIKLFTLYEMNEGFFDEEKLLERLYE